MKGTMLHVFSVGFDTLPELTPALTRLDTSVSSTASRHRVSGRLHVAGYGHRFGRSFMHARSLIVSALNCSCSNFVSPANAERSFSTSCRRSCHPL